MYLKIDEIYADIMVLHWVAWNIEVPIVSCTKFQVLLRLRYLVWDSQSKSCDIRAMCRSTQPWNKMCTFLKNPIVCQTVQCSISFPMARLTTKTWCSARPLRVASSPLNGLTPRRRLWLAKLWINSSSDVEKWFQFACTVTQEDTKKDVTRS